MEGGGEANVLYQFRVSSVVESGGNFGEFNMWGAGRAQGERTAEVSRISTLLSLSLSRTTPILTCRAQNQPSSRLGYILRPNREAMA